MKRELGVLVVEDYEMFREAIKLALEAEGYTVYVAGTVCGAKNHIDASIEGRRKEPPSGQIGAIVLDGNFPDGGGSDNRYSRKKRSHFAPAAEVAQYAQERGLGGIAIVGFSSGIMTPEDLGIGPQAGVSFTDVGKHSGGPREILEVLDNIS